MKSLANFNLLEESDPNDAVDQHLLHKKVGLDGENLALYYKLKSWIELQSDFIGQIDYDPRKSLITGTLQEKKGPKYLILHYHCRNKKFEIAYYNYDDSFDGLELQQIDKSSSPSTLDYLLEKYKKFLMENKQPLKEAKERTYSEAEIDELIRKASTSIHKLKDAVKGHLDSGRFVSQLGAIYKVLQDTPSLATLKKNLAAEKAQNEKDKADRLRSSVQEDIKIDAKANPNTIRKAEELAKKNDTDIELQESLTVGKLKLLIQEQKKNEPKKSLYESLLTENEKKKLNEDEAHQVYFGTYSAAVQSVVAEFEAKGYKLSESFSFPHKPKVGETVRINEQLIYKDTPSGVYVHIQVYNMDNADRTLEKPFELNYYYSFLHTNHFHLNNKQFGHLVDFLDSDIKMYDDQDMDFYSSETELPVETLMDYYAYYGMNNERIVELKNERTEFRGTPQKKIKEN